MSATTAAQLPSGVSRAVAAVDGDTLFVLGGLVAGDVTTDRVLRLDTTSLRVTPSGRLAQGVHDAAGGWLEGHALVFGGGAAQTVADVQSWSAGGGGRLVGRLPDSRSDSSAVVVGSTAYVVGGFDGHTMARDVLATTDGRRFHVVAELRVGVRYAAVAATPGALWVIGGQLATTEGTLSGGQTQAIQRVDLRTGHVTLAGQLPESLGHAVAFVLDGQLFVAGGRHRSVASDRIWRVDTQTGAATPAGNLPRAASDEAVAVVGSRAWLIGGETSGPDTPIRSVVVVRLAR